MTKPSRLSLLDDTLKLLVSHFGIEAVRYRLNQISGEDSRGLAARSRKGTLRRLSTPINRLLIDLRRVDARKHELLSDFYVRLKAGSVLPEAEDIRQFAHLVGIKQIEGKSRKDLIPRLVTALADTPTEKLAVDISSANSISERERQKGFSILTDKLLREK